jgi:hypothetical protein
MLEPDDNPKKYRWFKQLMRDAARCSKGDRTVKPDAHFVMEGSKGIVENSKRGGRGLPRGR